MIEVKNLYKRYGNNTAVKDVSFSIDKGEIVGFAGLVGAGRTETMRAIFGLDPHQSGTIKINGEEVKIKSPKESIDKKLVMLSESRREDGIVAVRSVKENATLASLKDYIFGGFTHKKKETDNVQKMFAKMNVKTPSLDTEIGTLSGGNQQKVLLTRWMLCNPDVMILDEPTRNFSPLSGPVIRKILREFPGAIISISHDRKYIDEVCDKIYRLDRTGLKLLD